MDANRNERGINAYAARLISFKAWELVRERGFTAQDVDDLIQEMTLDLWARLPKFDPNKATYKTFVAVIVGRKISTILRHRRAEMRDRRREYCSLNQANATDAPEAGGTGVTQEEHDLRIGHRNRSVEEQARLALDVASVLAKLPDRLRTLCEHLKTGTVTEAAQKVGMSRTTAYWHLRKVREAFRRAALREYL